MSEVPVVGSPVPEYEVEEEKEEEDEEEARIRKKKRLLAVALPPADKGILRSPSYRFVRCKELATGGVRGCVERPSEPGATAYYVQQMPEGSVCVREDKEIMLAYADDVAVVTGSQQDLQEAMTRWNDVLNREGMRMNKQKTYLLVDKQQVMVWL
ncbi:uncharacterized protein LOC135116338 [Scylla paramamosain]|uniref:uncharacterized protein LOC135116338 n=1 Tax=Scylla paramamosain TaxID=85552 RepID=UPI0030835FAB